LKKYSFTIIYSIALLLISCDADTIETCLAGIRPELEEKELVDGQKSFPYLDNITVNIQNAANSDYFIESTEIINENLPNGITYNVSDRTITFTGTPTENGDFEFGVRVLVRPYIFETAGSDNLCSNESNRVYRIKIK